MKINSIVLVCFTLLRFCNCNIMALEDRGYKNRETTWQEKPGGLSRSVYPIKQSIQLTMMTTLKIFEGRTTFFLEVFRETTNFAINMAYLKPGNMHALYNGWTAYEEIDCHWEFNSTIQQYIIRMEPSYLWPELPKGKYRVVLDFRGDINGIDFKMGAFYPDIGKEDVLTRFKEAYARTVFPCFDEAFFLTRFQLNLRVESDQRFWMLLSNTKSSHSSTLSVEFEETLPIPSYLVAFACLTEDNYKIVREFNYFDVPVRFIVDRSLLEADPKIWSTIYNHEEERAYPEGDEYFGASTSVSDLSILEEITFLTLTYCENVFRVNFTWPKIDVLFATGDGEHPGLIVIGEGHSCLGCVARTLVHHLVYQWTGVRIGGDYWDSGWINEGLTNYYQFEMLFQLESWKRLPPDTFSLTDKLSEYNQMGNLTGPIVLSRAEDPDKWGPGYMINYHRLNGKSSNAVAMLDDAMDLRLTRCLAVIMHFYDQTSANSQRFLEQLSTCPATSLHAVEFMHFWVYSKAVPVLQVTMSEDRSFESGHKLGLTYRLMCQLDSLTSMEQCKDAPSWSPDSPKFFITIEDFQNNILQDKFFYDSGQALTMESQFDPTKNPLYSVNLRRRGNYVVQYEDLVYDNFFRAIDQAKSENFTRNFTQIYKVPRMFSFFVTDLFELSRRNIVKFRFLFKTMEYMHLFKELDETDDYKEYRWPVFDILETFKFCLETVWWQDIDRNPKVNPTFTYIAQIWLCRLSARKDLCSLEFSWKADNQDCLDWVRIFGVAAADALGSYFWINH